MKPKDTEKLLELLKKTGSIDAYLQENKDFLLDCNIKEYLRALIREKGITLQKEIQKVINNYCQIVKHNLQILII